MRHKQMFLEGHRAGLAVKACPWWAIRESQRRKEEQWAWVAKETEKLGAKLDPEVRSWIKNAIVPILVRRTISQLAAANRVAEGMGTVPKSQSNSVPSAEGVQ